MRKFFSAFLLIVFSCTAATAQYTVTLRAFLPGAYTNETFFVAGNFNGWNPAADNYKLRMEGKNMATVSFRIPATAIIEFKFTKGSWEKVETTSTGADIENHRVKVESDTTVELTISGWRDWFPPTPKKSTATENVRIIDTAFAIPQLNTKRAVRIYLPPGYAGNKQTYPVLYMHDGQNLFDEALSPFGEWGIDEYLDSAKRKCIVVAIDNGGKTRVTEYNPYPNERFGAGKGKEYTAFIVRTLKPFIDKKFRTRKNAANTFIAGSSMGAHISFYAALKYPEVFGRAGIISPAFWINYKEVENEIMRSKKRRGQRLFIYAGQMESENLLQEVIGIFNLYNNRLVGNPVKLSIKAMGKHNEQSWRMMMPEFFEWLLK